MRRVVGRVCTYEHTDGQGEQATPRCKAFATLRAARSRCYIPQCPMPLVTDGMCVACGLRVASALLQSINNQSINQFNVCSGPSTDPSHCVVWNAYTYATPRARMYKCDSYVGVYSSPYDMTQSKLFTNPSPRMCKCNHYTVMSITNCRHIIDYVVVQLTAKQPGLAISIMIIMQLGITSAQTRHTRAKACRVRRAIACSGLHGDKDVLR